MINLSEYETEKTHKVNQELEDNAGTLLLMLSISGMTSNKYQLDQTGKTMNDVCREDIVRKYVSACIRCLVDRSPVCTVTDFCSLFLSGADNVSQAENYSIAVALLFRC